MCLHFIRAHQMTINFYHLVEGKACIVTRLLKWKIIHGVQHRNLWSLRRRLHRFLSPSAVSDNLASPLSTVHISHVPVGSECMPTYCLTNLLNPGQSVPKFGVHQAGANRCLNTMHFACTSNFHWHHWVSVNIPMHTPNIHPRCLHESPGSNQVLVDCVQPKSTIA